MQNLYLKFIYYAVKIHCFCLPSICTLRRLHDSFIDLFWPHRCLICGEIIDTRGLCTSCWSSIHWLNNKSETVFVQGHKKPLKVYAAMGYDALSKLLFLSLKFKDKTHFASYLASILWRRFVHVFAEYYYIVPVPMHFWSRMKRNYNQSVLIARYLCSHIHDRKSFAPHILKKIKMTQRQMRLSQAARLRNVRNAFKVCIDIKGAKILLIDDVMTTGATMYSCADTLLKAGASEVVCMVVARVM